MKRYRQTLDELVSMLSPVELTGKTREKLREFIPSEWQLILKKT